MQNKISEVQASCQLLKDEIKIAIDDFRKLLDLRLSVSTQSWTSTCTIIEA